jgi:hypothetical protein
MVGLCRLIAVVCTMVALSAGAAHAQQQQVPQNPVGDAVRRAIEQGMRDAEAQRQREEEEAGRAYEAEQAARREASRHEWLLYDVNCLVDQVRVTQTYIIIGCKEARLTDPEQNEAHSRQMFYAVVADNPDFAHMAIAMASDAFVSGRRIRLRGERQRSDDASSVIGYTQTPRLNFIQMLDSF